MNKAAIVETIRNILREEFESFQASSRETRAAGNDAESKSEGKYDTRSIEENYLADGLARQAMIVAEAALAYDKLELRPFDKSTPLDLGALLLLQYPDEKVWFFLGPSGGGIEVPCEGNTVTVVTPESPLGSQLMGLQCGAKLPTMGAKILKVE